MKLIKTLMKVQAFSCIAASSALLLAPSPACAVFFASDTTIDVGNTNYDGEDIVIFDCTLTVNGQHSFSDVLIVSQGTLTHSPYTNGLGGLNLVVSNNLVVEAGSAILVDARGFGGGLGAGAGTSITSDIPYGPPFYYPSGGGGSYGGLGGWSSGGAAGGASYGSLLFATNMGSGGGLGSGVGGAGGGVINIQVGGTILADGIISANGGAGTNTSSGGGSGGGIHLSAQSIAGAGSILANGGAGEPFGGGGGGGGRIALYVATNDFAGVIAAQGGTGATIGGAGTVYTKSANVGNPAYGQVVVDNGGMDGTNTVITTYGNFDLTISDGAVVSLPAGQMFFGNLFIVSNAWLMASNTSVTLSGNATIASGCGIIADFQGYAGGSGPGFGTSYYTNGYYIGGGAAHAGYGGENLVQAGEEPYDSITDPTEPGSGGGHGGGSSPYNAGGPGGGVIYLIVNGTLQLAGSISANGGLGAGEGSGGGSGGAIRITAAGLSGGGTISANGGSGWLPLGGGGGGGCIAVVLQSNQFTGSLTAYGGPGSVPGGAGTVYSLVQKLSSVGMVTVDNGGQQGTNTLWTVENSDLTIAHGGVVVPYLNPVQVRNLVIATNGVLTRPAVSGDPQALSITASGNATIQPGGAVVMDGLGYGSIYAGPGNGGAAYTNGFETGAGGGYGGYGGHGAAGGIGGNSYGSATQPSQAGSAGASTLGSSPQDLGGPGGGLLEFTVSGTLQVDGKITANGYPGVGQASGGGSGGGMLLNAKILAGGGVISANGGAGESMLGGGGGGGRVAVQVSSNLFAGQITAYGGPGFVGGGAGTVYLQPANSAYAQIVVDNGGLVGTNTPGSWSETMDVTVANGAVLAVNDEDFYVNNLVVGTNAILTPYSIESGYVEPLELNASGNVTIQAGGGIIADGKGYTSGSSGSGSSGTVGSSTQGGGGGFGGNGGSSAGGIPGGAGYSYSSTYGGSSGGNGGGTAPYNVGGTGGGYVELIVRGALTVAGTISANGTPGVGQASGGGSGGNISISATTLSGNGTISANGGAGEPSLGGGGGGGGGRIAVVLSESNAFTGNFTAYGGAGGVYGGAGTILVQVDESFYPESVAIPQIVLNNAGHRGTNTLIGSLSGYNYPSSTFDLTITNGAIGAMAGSSSTYSYLRNLLVASNSLLTFASSSSSLAYPMQLNLSGSATILNGGALMADGLGYGGEFTGAGEGYSSTGSIGVTGTGGGYGGNGGAGAEGLNGGGFYGSVTEPESVGSGGGAGAGNYPYNEGGAGGGAVYLSVSNLICAGTISANGLAGAGVGSGGGSGGSIYLAVGTLSGTGAISANGGAGESMLGGGGGGGRVAIAWNTNQFTGTITAYGGPGFAAGGPGTIYTKANGNAAGLVLVDGHGASAGTYTTLPSLYSVDLTLTNGARVNLLPGAQTIHNLLITSNSFLGIYGTNNPPPLTLTMNGNATVQRGGGIIADAGGYAGNQGSGAGAYSESSHGYPTGAGGSHGGYGGMGASGALAGSVTGSLLQSSDSGSGGGCPYLPYSQSAGGGVIHLSVVGTLDVDGTISANGATPSSEGCGGGAGGSISLTARQLTGAGVISANGGSGNLPYGGGGGGGLVAVRYTGGLNSNLFTGTVSAHGGQGFVGGGAGIVFSQPLGYGVGTALIDNAGLRGTNTPLSAPALIDLTVSGGAVGQTPSVIDPTLTLAGLLVQSNGLITALPATVSLSQVVSLNTENVSLVVLGDATVATNAAISVDGKGYDGLTPGGGGPGAGVMLSGGSGSGGGYGGAGGASASGEPGGAAYGSSQQPVNWGSRGGLPTTGFASLSQGGGAIRMEVQGTLTVNGTLSANGIGGVFPASGGGAGGSVWLSASTLAGHGAITANGGAGEPSGGGGGGGGRIAIYDATNNFVGATQALGGAGTHPGQNGTVVLAGLPTPQVIAQSPTGVVSSAVSSIVLTFDSQFVSDFLGTNFVFTSPTGALDLNSLSLSITNVYPDDYSAAVIAFPPQTNVGTYTFQLYPPAEDIFGLSIPAAYTGSFIISAPTVSGTVAGADGLPIPGVPVQTADGIAATNTDTNGNYTLVLPPSWSGQVAPSQAGASFVPASFIYANLSAPATNQNYVAVLATNLLLQAVPQGSNLNLNWYGAGGVTYLIQDSVDLVHWVPYGSPISGTNGPLNVSIPTAGSPQMFFRFGAY
jgi:hypothetical protein